MGRGGRNPPPPDDGGGAAASESGKYPEFFGNIYIHVLDKKQREKFQCGLNRGGGWRVNWCGGDFHVPSKGPVMGPGMRCMWSRDRRIQGDSDRPHPLHPSIHPFINLPERTSICLGHKILAHESAQGSFVMPTTPAKQTENKAKREYVG